MPHVPECSKGGPFDRGSRDAKLFQFAWGAESCERGVVDFNRRTDHRFAIDEGFQLFELSKKLPRAPTPAGCCARAPGTRTELDTRGNIETAQVRQVSETFQISRRAVDVHAIDGVDEKR